MQHATSVQLAVVFEGGLELLNTYSVLVNPSVSSAREARAFSDWLCDGGGRKIILGYRARSS